MTIKGFTADDSNVNAICCFPVRLAFPKQLYMKAAMLTLLPCLMRNALNLVNGSSCCCFAFAAPNATKRKGNQTLQRIVSVCCFSATIRIGVKAAQDSAGREAECHANIRWRGTQATAKGDIEMETTEQLTPITQTDSVIKKTIHATLDTPASAERALRSRLRRPRVPLDSQALNQLRLRYLRQLLDIKDFVLTDRQVSYIFKHFNAVECLNVVV